ncbi:ankyrin repeat and zinc finger domain-containing protein 1 isoform X2 [Bombina bombina]|uniref:ankyrin repeat and zinc finger domain-containing protein 1 isoform X2 n=1 Tax=Bombina bombina TaxID=8345 RepID=UPI00235A6C2C|nr:ankyrin repeat and zinc finger domain-containing protein 1 isoform X2 [Bombina bombina]
MERCLSTQSCQLFELSLGNPLLFGLSLNIGNVKEEFPEDVIRKSTEEPENNRDVSILEVSDCMRCSSCQCIFDSREDQKEHYTLDWHRFNLKRRIKGASLLSAEDFQDKTNSGDLSSISGSDSESSDDGELDSSNLSSADLASIPISDQSIRSQRVLFRNNQGYLLSVYRCVLAESKNTDIKPEHLLKCINTMQEQPITIILMAGGGHFAGAVFRGKEVLMHKTFHRYTVRAKRGTSQSVHDAQNRSHMPKSAGAALRRYNQAALIMDINQLLQSWAEHINEAWGIFLRAPRSDRTLFLGRNSPISKNDSRVHGIPFITRRATFREVQRVHTKLFTLQVYEKDVPLSQVIGGRMRPAKPKRTVKKEPCDEIEDSTNFSEEENEDSVPEELTTEELTLSTLDLREYEMQPKRKRTKKKKKSKNVLGSESAPDQATLEVQTSCKVISDQHVNEELELETSEHPSVSSGEGDELSRIRNILFTCCKTGDSETAKQILWNIFPNSVPHPYLAESCAAVQPLRLVNERLPIDQRTLLHVTASAGHGEVACLLMDAGWDPALRDSAANTPYSLCPDKVTRNWFRNYREEHPERYNYSKSQIPEPVSVEAENRRAEKKRAQKAQRKQREKEEKEQRLQKEKEEAEKKRFAALSDREKRAVAAERRLAAQRDHIIEMEGNVSRRCWQCGESLSGKVPFEYFNFSFCTTRCLQDHRRTNAAKS